MKPDTKAFIHSILEAHVGIRAHLDEVSDVLDTEARVSAQRVSMELAALRARLRRHFAAEEASEIFAVLDDTLPQKRATIEALLGDHARILATMDDIVSRVQSDPPLELKQLREGLSLLHGLLAAHEAAEERLLDRALADA